MKQLFTFILCVVAISATAQSLVFSKNGSILENNLEYTVTKATFDELNILVLESDLGVKNASNELAPVRATQTLVEFPPFFMDEHFGFLNFCFNGCQQGNGNQEQIRNMEAGEWLVPTAFHLCFYPKEGAYSRVKVRYEITVMEVVGQNDLGFPIYEPTDEKATVT
ncbi:MAG: hypothetical protein LBG77_07550, partial [Dysgonamonadaceae bacterium]|nr:hypothetical protein [Dysgonamonadaceae bacterium]